MKISIIFILIYVIAPSWCQDETVFHCSPKPGCQIAQCDQVAVGWDRPGFNIDKQLHDKEFPITCKSKNAAKPQNNGNLFSLVSRNILDIGHIKSDVRELQENFEDKLKNMDTSGNDESDSKIEEQSKEINNLKRRDKQQSEEIKKLKEEFNELRAMNSTLVGEQSKIAQQSTEIRELKEDLVQIEEININLVEELNEQKKINDEMKKAISHIEQRLAVKEKPQKSRYEQFTKPTTKTQTTLKPTPAPENCRLKVGNICYFAVIHVDWGVKYDTAVGICKKRKADVGLIRREESYNAIMNYLRKNIPKGWMGITIWTGIHFDPMTDDVTPADLFIKWFPGDPGMGIGNEDRTNIYLNVLPNTNDRNQGMRNGYPSWGRSGVICEILM